MIRTPITLDDDVHAKLKAEMRRSGRSLKETVNEALRIGLLRQPTIQKVEPKARKAKPFKIRARGMGLKPGYSFDKPWGLIEEIEGPDYE
jgi:plasmid stability protein